MNEEIKNILENHENRLRKLEGRKEEPKLQEETNEAYLFKEKNRDHAALLEELLKSDFCHERMGLSREEIIQIFAYNKRPVVPKKINDLLGVWKKRKKIEARKDGPKLKYFWINNEN